MKSNLNRLLILALSLVSATPAFSMLPAQAEASARAPSSPQDELRATAQRRMAQILPSSAPAQVPAQRTGILASIRRGVSRVAGWISSWRSTPSAAPTPLNDGNAPDPSNPAIPVQPTSLPQTRQGARYAALPMPGRDISNVISLANYYRALIAIQTRAQTERFEIAVTNRRGEETEGHDSLLRRLQEMFHLETSRRFRQRGHNIVLLLETANIPGNAGPLFEAQPSIRRSFQGIAAALDHVAQTYRDLVQTLSEIDESTLYSGERTLVRQLRVAWGEEIEVTTLMAAAFRRTHPSPLQAYILFEALTQHLETFRGMYIEMWRDGALGVICERLGLETIREMIETLGAVTEQMAFALLKPARFARSIVHRDIEMPDVSFISPAIRRNFGRMVRDALRRSQREETSVENDSDAGDAESQAQDSGAGIGGSTISLTPASVSDKGDSKRDARETKDDGSSEDSEENGDQESPHDAIEDSPKPKKEKRGGTRKQRQESRRQAQAGSRTAGSMSLQPNVQSDGNSVYLNAAQRIELFQRLTADERAELQRFFGIPGDYNGDNNRHYNRSTILNVVRIVTPILRKMGFSDAAIKTFEKEFKERADHYPHRRGGTYPQHYVDIARGAWVVRGVHFPLEAWISLDGQAQTAWVPQKQEDRAALRKYELANALGGN